MDTHSYPESNICVYLCTNKHVHISFPVLEGKESVIHFCRLPVSHSWKALPPCLHITAFPLLHQTPPGFAQWTSWAPRKPFILSQLCLIRQMFYIKNTKFCPEVLASKNSPVALAFGRWCNALWTCVLQSPLKGRRQNELTGDWGGGIGWAILSLMMCDFSV